MQCMMHSFQILFKFVTYAREQVHATPRPMRTPAPDVQGEPEGVLFASIYQDWESGLRSRDSVRD